MIPKIGNYLDGSGKLWRITKVVGPKVTLIDSENEVWNVEEDFVDILELKPVAGAVGTVITKPIFSGRDFDVGDYIQFHKGGPEYYITGKTKTRFELVDTANRKQTVPLNTPLILVDKNLISKMKTAPKAVKQPWVIPKIAPTKSPEERIEAALKTSKAAASSKPTKIVTTKKPTDRGGIITHAKPVKQTPLQSAIAEAAGALAIIGDNFYHPGLEYKRDRRVNLAIARIARRHGVSNDALREQVLFLPKKPAGVIIMPERPMSAEELEVRSKEQVRPSIGKAIATFKEDQKDSFGAWQSVTIPVLSLSDPINITGKTSYGNWVVKYETPSVLGGTGKQTNSKYFWKKVDAQKWIDDLKNGKSIKPKTSAVAKKSAPKTAPDKQPWQMTDREWQAAMDETRPDGQGYATKYGGMGKATSEKSLQKRWEAAQERQQFLTMNLPSFTDAMGEKRKPTFFHVLEHALTAGLPVPPEVLADYPELQGRAAVRALAPVGHVDPKLKAKKARLAKRIEGIDRKEDRARETDMPGSFVTGGSGVPSSRHKKLSRQLDRTIKRAHERIETDRELSRVEAQIQAQKKAPMKEMVRKTAQERMEAIFADIKVGDKIDIGGNALLTVIKKNQKTVVTEGGGSWKAEEIGRVEKTLSKIPAYERTAAGEQAIFSGMKGRVVPKRRKLKGVDKGTAGLDIFRGKLKEEQPRLELKPGKKLVRPVEKATEEKPVVLSKKVRATIVHKIAMALTLVIRHEHGGYVSDKEAVRARKDAVVMTDIISAEYASKKAAGALWLNQKLKDSEWLANLQEKAFVVMRLKRKSPKKAHLGPKRKTTHRAATTAHRPATTWRQWVRDQGGISEEAMLRYEPKAREFMSFDQRRRDTCVLLDGHALDDLATAAIRQKLLRDDSGSANALGNALLYDRKLPMSDVAEVGISEREDLRVAPEVLARPMPEQETVNETELDVGDKITRDRDEYKVTIDPNTGEKILLDGIALPLDDFQNVEIDAGSLRKSRVSRHLGPRGST